MAGEGGMNAPAKVTPAISDITPGHFLVHCPNKVTTSDFLRPDFFFYLTFTLIDSSILIKEMLQTSDILMYFKF